MSQPIPLLSTSPLTDDGPAAELVPVTPELAREWLKVNTINRPIRERTVTNYARDMAAGRWPMNGEAIKRARGGDLLDGQHRLLAVIQAGVTVVMLVISNLPPETQETMDSGMVRTVGDAFSLSGETYPKLLAAVVKKVWWWELEDFKFSANYTPTKVECRALLQKHPEIRRSVEIAVRTHGNFKCLRQSVVGAAHHLLSRIAPDEAVWFFARLGDGAELPSSHPILALRSRAMSERVERRQNPPYMHMAYIIRAWNAVRQDRPLQKIQVDPNAPMPMPL